MKRSSARILQIYRSSGRRKLQWSVAVFLLTKSLRQPTSCRLDTKSIETLSANTQLKLWENKRRRVRLHEEDREFCRRSEGEV